MDNQDVLRGVCNDTARLDKSLGCPAVIYRMMESCWQSQPNQRATASWLVEQLQTLEEKWSKDADSCEILRPLDRMDNGELVESNEGRCCNTPRAVDVLDDKQKVHCDYPVKLHDADGCAHEASQNWLASGKQTDSGESRCCNIHGAVNDDKNTHCDAPTVIVRPSCITTAFHTNVSDVPKENNTSSPASLGEELPPLDALATKQSATTVPSNGMHDDLWPPAHIDERAEETTRV